MKLNEYLSVYEQTVRRRSKPTGVVTKLQIISNYLRPYFGERELEDITRFEVRKFSNWLYTQKGLKTKRPLTPKTINNITTVLAHILTSASDDEVMTRDAPRIQKEKVPHKDSPRLTLEELEKLLATPMPLLWKRMFIFCAFTGLRIGEVRGLDWKDVNLDKMYINVCRSAPQHSKDVRDDTKTGKSRETPIGPTLKNILKTFSRSTGLVFEDPRNPGKPLSYEICNRALTAACKAAGIRRITPHIFRHTYISLHVADANNSTGLVRFFAGHSDIRMTQSYVGRDQSKDQAAMNAFESLFSPEVLCKLQNA